MTDSLRAVTWPESEMAACFEAMASAAGFATDALSTSNSPRPTVVCKQWIETAGRVIGAEMEEIQLRYHELTAFLQRGAPALIPIEVGSDRRLLLVIGKKGRRLRIVRPDRRTTTVSTATIRDAVAAPFEAPLRDEVQRTLECAGITTNRQPSCRQALLAQRLGSRPVCSCWMIRPLPGTSFRRQLARSGDIARTVMLVLCHLAQTAVFLAAWWLVGRGALSGNLDLGWLGAWGLMLLSLVPLRMLTVSLQGRAVLSIGALLKRRLLDGVLKLDLESVKGQGVGSLLGRVLESNALESLALTGGYRTLLSIIEIAATVWVLGRGAGGPWHGLLYLAWIAATVALAWRFWRKIRVWTSLRLTLTLELAESLVGHRTRLAQQPSELWHHSEDANLEQYHEASQTMDRVATLVAGSGTGWRLLGMTALAGAFISSETSVAALAVSLGGIILGAQAVASFTSGLAALAIAAVAWTQVKEMYRSAAADDHPGTLLPMASSSSDKDQALIALREVSFAFPGRDRKALDTVHLEIQRGDRLLVLGPSGGGKSTLAAMLSSLRTPDTGLALCHGLDLPTLGASRWRRSIVSAPQFHENHVLTETFAFNLLMGRRWPASSADLGEAEDVCRELGLGELLDRMPSGMMQMVGDTGWQLSHGEKSRLFVARALLQSADLVILDECFGTLDPDNLRLAVDCARRRANTLAVIAHP